MAYAVRTIECATCGKESTGRYRPAPPHRCLACAVEHQRQTVIAQHAGNHSTLPKSIEAGRAAADQIRNREGPVYEKWRANIIAAALADDDE